MNISKIDIFSSSFQFDFGKQIKRKGTYFGAFLSTFLIITMVVFSAYLFYQFFSSQINPNYASQSMIQEDMVDVELSEDLVGFKYEYGVNLSLDDLQEQQNKTYLVFVPYLYYQNGSYFEMIKLNYTKCQNPKLQGFNCFDFSTVKNYSLSLSTSDNISTNINLLVYKCQDVDEFKTFIPNNCAEDSNFDSVINNPYADFRLKLKTSQYNTTSQQAQVSYRNSYAFFQDDQFMLYTYKTQKQITKLKRGAIIQSESTFSSPIQYNVETMSFNRQSFVNSANQTSYMLITIEMDEIVQEIQIQYSTFTQILAQCNSTLALLMCLGFLGRKFAKKLMREEIFLLLLQNVFHGTYERILKKNSQIDKQNNEQIKNLIKYNQIKLDQKEEDQLIESNQSIFIPTFDTKSIKSVDNQYITLQTQKPNIENNKQLQDEIIEQDQINLNEIFDSNNFVKTQNSEQIRYLEQKKQLQSPKNQKNIFDSCSQYIQSSTNQKPQILSQESLFKKKSRGIQFKKSHSIYSVSQQSKYPFRHNAENLKIIQENYLKKMKTMRDQSILKSIQKKIFQTKYQDLQAQALLRISGVKLNRQAYYRRPYKLKLRCVVTLQRFNITEEGSHDSFNEGTISSITTSRFILRNFEVIKMSHYEEQFAILTQSNLQEEYISSFIKRIFSSQAITEVDQRIIDSLI